MEEGYKLVEKETISDFNFPKEDIIKSEKTMKELNRQLERAITLGNIEHHKIKIYFADDEGDKVVHTTIWGVTDKYILLKKNVTIPKNRLIKLDI